MVNTYLAAHSLESTIEEAVNDAVLKQVKNPCRHIAEILLKKSEEMGESPNAKGRISLDGPALETAADKVAESSKKTAFAAVDVVSLPKEVSSSALAGDEELSRQYTKSDVEMPADLVSKLKTFFDRMDADGNGEVSKEEAVAFWGKNFAKVNAQSMFNEVDEDGNESISWDEFRAFWQNVIGSGYPADDLVEEVDMMLEGGSWVDFNDGRTT